MIFKYQNMFYVSPQTPFVKQKKNDNTFRNWLISLINKNRSQRNNEMSGTRLQRFYKWKDLCVQSTTGDSKKLEHFLSWEKNTSLTQITQTDCPCPPVQFLYCSECMCSWWMFRYQWLMHRFYTMHLSLCRSLSSQFLTHTHTHTHTHTLCLCVSMCLALFLPPTTHSMLYKSYINASSAPFWWWTS